MTKTESELSVQRTSLFMSVAILHLSGQVDKETANRMYARINRAFAKMYFSLHPIKSDIPSDERMKRLREWLDRYPVWLAESTEYARGYKAGILQAMEIVNEIINR